MNNTAADSTTSPPHYPLISVPIARIEPGAAVVGAERLADRDRCLEVIGKMPMGDRRAVHAPAWAGGPIQVPGARHDSQAGEKVTVAQTKQTTPARTTTTTTATESPSGCFLP